MIDLRRVLVPTDFSTHSNSALTYAAAFAEKFGAELHLLHVVQDLALFLPDTVTVAPPTATAVEQFSEAARAALEGAVRELPLKGLKAFPVVREGAPYAEVVRYAKEADIDLIVMGTHGHTGLARLLLGSVAEKVVRSAPCPVLTVRHPEHEFVHP